MYSSGSVQTAEFANLSSQVAQNLEGKLNVRSTQNERFSLGIPHMYTENKQCKR